MGHEGVGHTILLAVRPRVLQDALARMLCLSGFDEVVEFHPEGQWLGHYDAAVVTTQVPEGVHAAVVITLPDQFGSAGLATIQTGSRSSEEVAVASCSDIVALLDRLIPGPASRSDELANLKRPLQ